MTSAPPAARVALDHAQLTLADQQSLAQDNDPDGEKEHPHLEN